ncbi:MAG TPA: hypothetical protein VIJ87_08325, partial [Pyrinomonadaceae bacterium]
QQSSSRIDERMKTGPIGEKCQCGADNWCITATMIECLACFRLWGRVNGLWVEVIEPQKTGG